MQEVAPSVLAALTIGLMGGGHCMAMCGGIVAALSLAQEGGARSKHWLVVCYNLGRITTYSLLGGAVAAFAGSAPATGLPLARTLAGVLLILLGLHFLGKSRSIVWLERLGHGVWRVLKPIAARLLPVDRPQKAFFAGIIWGWLPCGLVYSTLVYATTQGTFASGAAVMLGFGVGTLPALLIGGLAAGRLQQWFRRPSIRTIAAISYIAFGVWTLAFAWYHAVLHHHQPHPEHSELPVPHH